MLAVIKTGGKQYLVSPGDKIKIEKLDKEEGKEIRSNNHRFAPVMNPKPVKEESKGFMNLNLGLPNVDEFQDRLSEAIEN